MEILFDMTSRISPARLIRNAATRRKIGTITLGVLASSLIAPCGVFGEPVTIDLSPMVAKSTLVSSAGTGKEISVILSLPLGDAQGAAQFVQRVSNPKDPLYRQYITPKEFAARYGANAGDYAALKAWATANGLAIVHESTARTGLTVRGTVAQFQELFKTQLNNYRSADGKEFYSASVKPTIPSAISSKVAGVIGLTNSIQYAPLAKVYKTLGENPVTPAIRTDTAGGTGPGGSYSAADLRTAYSIPAFGGVVPQSVAVFEQGGFFASDVDKYLDTMKLRNTPVKFVGVNGYNGSVNDLGVELEAVLDIDMVIGINPAVKEVLVYEDGTDPFGVAIIDALEAVASDNFVQTLSISYGLDEVQAGNSQLAAENTVLTQLAAEGITVLVSAGDGGAYGRTGTFYFPAQLEAPDPGSQPLITSVGGTSLYTGPGGVYAGESVWNHLLIGAGATGGGVSSYWAIPTWQSPSYVTGNGGSSTFRNVPDVAAVGDPLTGVGVYSKQNGGWIQIGGTSVSAPIWGGYISILNAGFAYLINQKIGFFNPTLYGIGFGNPSNYLYPVPDGTNGNAAFFGTPGYNAGYGYNNCAGSGTPFGGGFALQVLTSETGGTPPAGFVFFPIKVTETTATVHWTAASQALGYAIGLFNPGPLFNNSAGFVSKTSKYTFTGLQPNTTYSLYVGAVNAGGSTVLSTSFTTLK